MSHSKTEACDECWFEVISRAMEARTGVKIICALRARIEELEAELELVKILMARDEGPKSVP